MICLPVLILFVLVSVVSAEEPPRPRLAPETLSMLEGRVSGLEERVEEIEGKLETESSLSEDEVYAIYDDNRFDVVEILLESPKLSITDAVELFVKRGGLKKKTTKTIVRDLRTVHDNLHNVGRSGIINGTGNTWNKKPINWQGSWQPVQYYTSPPFRQNCPGGVCPR